MIQCVRSSYCSNNVYVDHEKLSRKRRVKKPVYPKFQNVYSRSEDNTALKIVVFYFFYFQEFLFFILPLINFQRIKNFIVRTVLPKSLTQSRKSQNSERNFTSCAICGDWPIRAQEIGCVHVFCYYCIQVSVWVMV